MNLATLYDDTLCDICDEPRVVEYEQEDGAPPLRLCIKHDAMPEELLGGCVFRSDRRLFEEVKKDPVALSRLKAKQVDLQWSSMKVLAVLGDPRQWSVEGGNP